MLLAPTVDLYRRLREWQTMKLHRSIQHTFTILTYNLLAQNYIKREIYPYCAKETLKWAYRRRRLLCELEAYQADIGCLQVTGHV